MNKTVFLNVEKLDYDKKLIFSPLFELATTTMYDTSTDAEIIERVQGQNLVITKELSLGKSLIDQFPPSVRLICEAGTGYNNIDIDAARSKNITVCNVPDYSSEAVAHLIITFILNISSSLVPQQNMLQHKNFKNFTKSLQVPHFELQGKTLGIIGAGTIGRRAQKIALALGMSIMVYDISPQIKDESKVRYVPLEELLASSDFVSINCPLNSTTKHLVNKKTLALMKPTAFIINTSRGQLINEVDLIDALQNGKIAGAALDVQEQEPPELDNPLFSMGNVIMTPHIGWRRIESRQRLVQIMADNIKAFINGAPINVVNGPLCTS